MKVKRTDNPQDYFDDLEAVFKTPEFQKLLNNHIYGNVDYDIFIKIFVMYFIVYIQAENKNAVESTVKKLLTDKNSRKKFLELKF